jgi:hypothetical protein
MFEISRSSSSSCAKEALSTSMNNSLSISASSTARLPGEEGPDESEGDPYPDPYGVEVILDGRYRLGVERIKTGEPFDVSKPYIVVRT